jgi:hypothetical protein
VGPDEPHLTAEEVELVLERLTPLKDQLVLIGGQALNLWVEHYSATPELADIYPTTSKDLDFCGGQEIIQRSADLLGGWAELYSVAQRTTGAGRVICSTGTIDFLREPLGVPVEQLQRRAVVLEAVRVMHPLDVLRSRAANVARIPRDDDHSLNQLRAAVLVAREHTRALLAAGGPRPAQGANEEIATVAMSDDGLSVWRKHSVDVFLGVLVDETLGEAHLTKRIPQLRAWLDRRRAQP